MKSLFPFINNTVSKEEFLTFWSKRYFYKSKHDYESLMNQDISEVVLSALFEWKNGMNLSERKEHSFQNNILNQCEKIREYRKNLDLDAKELYDLLDKVSFVWRIFACHIARPEEYPIYDQNIHRSVLYIQGDDNWQNVTPSLNDQLKSDFYFNNYKKEFLPQFSDIPSRDIDRALFAFGRYLRDFERHAYNSGS
jgi:hypothetical protein